MTVQTAPDLTARKNAAIAQAHAARAEIRGGNGRRFIDFAAGIAVVNTGHRHPRLAEAAQQRGLVPLTCGVYGNVIRVLTPETLFDEALGILEAAIPAARV